MSDFEYYGTISAFIAGLVLLVYLFRIRTIIFKKAKRQLLQAKIKIHHMSRPSGLEVDPWAGTPGRKLRPDVTVLELNGLFEEDTTWGVDTYREKEIR